MNRQLSDCTTVGVKRKSFCKSATIKTNTNIRDNVVSVIDLCSDKEDSESENESDVPSKSCSEILYSAKQNKNRNDSETTIIYLPSTPEKTPQSPSCGQLHSPTSKKTFFSPSKNRRIISPQKTKKNLNNVFSNIHSSLVDQPIPEDSKSYDDKTQFLLITICKYLKNDSLRSLLPEDVDKLLSKCTTIVKPGMRLVCRLYWRKRGWYRKDSIRNIAINNDDSQFELMVNSLVEHNIVETSKHNDNLLNFDDLVQILKADELKKICKEFKLKVQNKESAIKSLKNFALRKTDISSYIIGAKSDNQNRVLRMLKHKAGICYKLSEIAHIAVTKLLYLMNLGIDYSIIREKKLELMFINSKANKETYPIDETLGLDNASVVFNDRYEFESYYNACLIFEKWEAANSSNEKLAIISKVFDMYKNITEEDMKTYKSLPLWLQRFTPAHEYVKILDSGVQELKKEKNQQCYSSALDILSTLILQSTFRVHYKAEWHAEKALILDKHMNCNDQAAEVLLRGLTSDLPEETKQVMRLRAKKIATVKCKELSDKLREELLTHAANNLINENDFEAIHVHHKPMENYKGGKIKFQTFTAYGERVVKEAEEFCIDHYLTSYPYTDGKHWEGKIITTIFFLLFWAIIYMKMPCIRGIFLSQFQTYPMDLFTESFYVNRKTLVDERLVMIQNSSMDEILAQMQETWTKRPECELSGITRNIGWDNIASVCTCLGAGAIAAICRRLVLNYRYAHSGFPDLTLWNSHTGQIKFVEVKTDSDKPSIKQLQWMQYLRGCGVPVEFCYVGINTTRCKARTHP